MPRNLTNQVLSTSKFCLTSYPIIVIKNLQLDIQTHTFKFFWHILCKGADIPREQLPKLKIPPATPSNKQHQDYVSSPVSPTRSTGSDPTDHNDGALTLDDRE